MNKIIRVVGCAMALVTAAHAAEDEQSGDSEQVLDEVVVFAERSSAATKTDALLVEIPQSISVITAEQFTERGSLNFQDVFRYSAGVDTERSGLEVRSDFFSARGFALKQYLDGLNTTPDFVYGSRMEVFTLERAEVLRGPSAVLYGAGSSGGLLNAVSKRPDFDFGAELGVQVGNFDRRQLQADVTGPLGESVAGRLVGVARNGELLSPGQPDDKYVVMPSLTWRAGDRTEITLIGLYQKEDMGTQTYVPLSKTLHADGDDPAIPHDLFIGEPGFNHIDTDRYSTTLLLEHDFNDLVSFSSSSRYINQTVDYAEVYGFPPWEDAERTVIGREFYVLDGDYYIYNTDNNVQLDFETGDFSHRVLFGIDYTLFEHERQEGFSCRGFTGGTCFAGGSPPGLDVYDPVYGLPFDYGFTNAYDFESTQLGFYVQDQISWRDRVSMILGARRDRATSERTGLEKFENDATTFKIGIIAEVADGVSPYLSYSESFTPLFGGDFFGNPFKPQEARQYEGGIKWQPRADSLLTVSYYDIRESNFLQRDPDNIQNRIQSGEIGAKGYEIEAIVNFDNGFGVTANYSYTDAEVLEGTTSHPAGDRVEGIPDHLASLWINKAFFVSEDLSWRIGAGVRQTGDEIDFGQNVLTPTRTLVDAMARVDFEDWRFSLNVNNVADKEFYASCGGNPFDYGFDGTCSPGQTRVIIGTVTKTF